MRGLDGDITDVAPPRSALARWLGPQGVMIWTVLSATVMCGPAGEACATISVPEGFAVELFFSGPPLETIRGLAVSPGGTLYVADRGDPDVPSDSRIVAVDVATRTSSVILSGLPFTQALNDITLGDGRPLLGSDPIVADPNSEETSYCCDGRVLRVNRGDGSWTSLSEGNPAHSPPGDPSGLALAPLGIFPSGLYVMDYEGDSVSPPVLFRINDNGSRDVVLTAPDTWTADRNPQKMEFAPPDGPFLGDIFALEWRPVPTIWRIAPSLDLSILVTGAPLERPESMKFAPGNPWGDALLVFDTASDTACIWAVDPSGSLSVYADGFPPRGSSGYQGGGLAFGPDGQSLYVGLVNAIYRIWYIGTDVPHQDPPSGLSLRVSPNPVSKEARIDYSLPSPGDVAIEIFDLGGRRVTSWSRQHADIGPHVWFWEGHAAGGTSVSSGVYFVRLTAGGQTFKRSFVIIR